ncbi:MAG TPA: hypothetical protein EYQ83_07665, partial [Acidobacteria bacterium]|nr:hypothetical protein [Acidobacteriota bacterium]
MIGPAPVDDTTRCTKTHATRAHRGPGDLSRVCPRVRRGPEPPGPPTSMRTTGSPTTSCERPGPADSWGVTIPVADGGAGHRRTGRVRVPGAHRRARAARRNHGGLAGCAWPGLARHRPQGGPGRRGRAGGSGGRRVPHRDVGTRRRSGGHRHPGAGHRPGRVPRGAHARQRQTFGRPIGRYQAVQWMMADMATELDAARMLTYRAAAAKATQPRCTTEAAMAKLYASEAAHRAADHAMQIFAAAGYARGSTVERLVRDGHLRVVEAVLGELLAQEMLAGDHQLLLARVAGDGDDLHPVEERSRDALLAVGRGDEHHLGEVEGDVEVVVHEGVVLLRVQDLEQRAGRV